MFFYAPYILILWLLLQEQGFSENDAFFAWTFVKRRPLWQTLLSFFWPVLTLAICLFPVYPHRCKLLILYSCLGVLVLFFSLLGCKCQYSYLSTSSTWTSNLCHILLFYHHWWLVLKVGSYIFIPIEKVVFIYYTCCSVLFSNRILHYWNIDCIRIIDLKLLYISVKARLY